jgi:hypothetical protein
MADKLEHNVWIAHALNFAAVSLILMVVKAETRIEIVVDKVRDYAERFADLIDIMGVCITHMDVVNWQQDEFKNCLQDELGIGSVIFVGKATRGEQIKTNILSECRERPLDLRITSGNFLKYFKINNNNIKILKSVREEIGKFQVMKQDFTNELSSGNHEAQDKVDMVFEFQAFMNLEVYEAQKRVSDSNSFTFAGDNTASEAGHVANLTNQLRATLLDVRTMALGYQTCSGISSLRKCPHCNQVWAKLEGCDGETTCGSMPSRFDGRFNTLANFRFDFDGKHLTIAKVGHRPASASTQGSARSNGSAGCGKSITWSQMAPVTVPPEFNVQAVATTDDVTLIPARARPLFRDVFEKVENAIGDVKKTFCGQS